MSILLGPVSVSVGVNTTVGEPALPLADLRGHEERPPVQILSISCSFCENRMLLLPRRVGTPTSVKSWIRNCLHFPKNPWKLRNIWSVWLRRFPWNNHYETPITKICRIVLTSHLFIFSEHMVVHKQSFDSYCTCYKMLGIAIRKRTFKIPWSMPQFWVNRTRVSPNNHPISELCYLYRFHHQYKRHWRKVYGLLLCRKSLHLQEGCYSVSIFTIEKPDCSAKINRHGLK